MDRKYKYISLIILIWIVGSFLIGYICYDQGYNKAINSFDYKPSIVYLSSEPIQGTIDSINLVPNYIIVGGIKENIKIKDSIVRIPTDTAGIIADFNKIKHYDIQLFDVDTLGTCSISTDVQYNRLMNLSYQFSPINKTIEHSIIVKPKDWNLVGGVGLNTINMWNIQVGAFYRHIGATYQFTNEFGKNSYSHGINIMFKY